MILRTAIVTLLAASGLASANVDPPKPMTAVAAGKTACETIALTDPGSACKVVSSEKIDGLGRAQLLSAGILKKGMTFALAIDVGGKTYVTEPIYAQSDCGMNKCDSPLSAVPKMRVITRKHASLEVKIKWSHDATNPDTNKTVSSEKWESAQFVICKQTTTGVPACSYRSFGARGAACTASLDGAGTLTHSCAETESFGN